MEEDERRMTEEREKEKRKKRVYFSLFFIFCGFGVGRMRRGKVVVDLERGTCTLWVEEEVRFEESI